VRRRRFDHLYEELSVRLGRLAPRYALWLWLRERGADPERLSLADALRFSREDLPRFLSEHGLALEARAARSLLRAVERHDPRVPTPVEWASRF
jgi:hypothetical protein